MPKSAYIHIPFCKSKCKYCSFVSYVKDVENSYFDALLKDIDINYQGEELNTLYFGGGTPSLVDIKIIEKVLSRFNLAESCEVTFEMNPDDSDIEYLKGLKSLGVNRLSMGSQTFDDNVLKLIGRRHTSSDTIKAVENAKTAGFDNISLDLIYGLPDGVNIKNDLNIITNLDIQHISTYGLKIEEGSHFYIYPPKNLPDDDMQADMYLEINDYLSARGYQRYEISNFARKGFESRHNLNYWNNEEYYGFGAAAHGYVNGVRYSNFLSLKDYSQNPSGFAEVHKVSQQEKLEEAIFLRFRKESGVNIEKINKDFEIDFDNKYKSILNKYLPQYIQKTPYGYKLTLEGVLLSNNILAEFI